MLMIKMYKSLEELLIKCNCNAESILYAYPMAVYHKYSFRFVAFFFFFLLTADT